MTVVSVPSTGDGIRGLGLVRLAFRMAVSHHLSSDHDGRIVRWTEW